MRFSKRPVYQHTVEYAGWPMQGTVLAKLYMYSMLTKPSNLYFTCGVFVWCSCSQQKEEAAQQQAALQLEAAAEASGRAATIGTAFQLNNLPEHDSSGILLQPFTATTAALLPDTTYSFGISSSSSSSGAVDSAMPALALALPAAPAPTAAVPAAAAAATEAAVTAAAAAAATRQQQ
jgi:hypothetical protein